MKDKDLKNATRIDFTKNIDQILINFSLVSFSGGGNINLRFLLVRMRKMAVQ
jgi:hypothetical protein